MYICACACASVCVCVCVFIYAYILYVPATQDDGYRHVEHLYIYTHTHMHMHIYAHAYVCACACACSCVENLCVYMQTCTTCLPHKMMEISKVKAEVKQMSTVVNVLPHSELSSGVSCASKHMKKKFACIGERGCVRCGGLSLSLSLSLFFFLSLSLSLSRVECATEMLLQMPAKQRRQRRQGRQGRRRRDEHLGERLEDTVFQVSLRCKQTKKKEGDQDQGSGAH